MAHHIVLAGPQWLHESDQILSRVGVLQMHSDGKEAKQRYEGVTLGVTIRTAKLESLRIRAFIALCGAPWHQQKFSFVYMAKTKKHREVVFLCAMELR